MGYLEESGLCGIGWAIWKSVVCVEERELYGRVTAVWKTEGFVGYSGLCGIVWAVWYTVRYKE